MQALAPPNLTQMNDPIATSESVLLHHVVGGSGSNEQIVSVRTQDGATTPLAMSNGQIAGFAADDRNVYFADSGGVKSIAQGGGLIRLLSVNVTSHPSGLAVVGANVFVTSAADEAVYGVPVQGGSPTTIAAMQFGAQFPLPCASDICWWTGGTSDPLAGPAPGAIERLNSNGTITTIPGATAYPWSIAFDGSDFFETVGCDICPGSLIRIPSSGAGSTLMRLCRR